jgi:hypothetical protein
MDPKGVARFLEANRERFFGIITLDKLELVINDWYQRSANTEKSPPSACRADASGQKKRTHEALCFSVCGAT